MYEMLLLKDKRAGNPITINVADLVEDDEFRRIRCPHCKWHPTASSRWCCYSHGTPEPFFNACGTVWNTFSTRGRCPGCNHQWQWTSCLRCQEWSRHEDWYERHGSD